MIHYHGTPITPIEACVPALQVGHAFISFVAKEQLPLAAEICQSFALDNGAFSYWKAGTKIESWAPYYSWVRSISRHPSFDFAVIPDVVEGSEEDNDRLLSEWPLGRLGAPVWHLHESDERLNRLCLSWPRVCLGSSKEYSSPGSQDWWARISRAMDSLCDEEGYPPCKLHGLRMLNQEIFTKLPLSSADSTNIARNVGIDKAWTGSLAPASKLGRARVLRERIEAFNSASVWDSSIGTQAQEKLF